MKFEDFIYIRPKMGTIVDQFTELLDAFDSANTFEKQSELFASINEIRAEFSTMYSICQIRHTINTKDKFYEKENTFFDKNNPKFTALRSAFYQKILVSPFRKELEAKWGTQLFVIAELSIKSFEPSILKDLQKENKLSSDYVKVKAKGIINFEGKDYNLSSIIPLETSEDRATRKAAVNVKWAFFEKHADEIEQIYHKQVQIRHKIAQKLGYKNFIELGYARMLRSDYNAEMVANFRKQVLEHIVPLCTKLYERQRERLGLDSIKHYDEDFRFASGNPSPKGEPEWIIEQAKQMYSELSAETKEFFDFMNDNNLMDLVNKDGKATGGYCTFVNKYSAPYIFSNFNGTSGDIDVLTHEAGHAFQVYSSRNIGLSEYHWPTYEACEIHSMSMEFFTWPWMHLFFKGEEKKYKFAHLTSALKFLPYGVAVDEFQHIVYQNPSMTPAERNTAWRTIEKKYLPHRDYDGNEFLEKGTYWYRQSHIFSMPFYYIDYTLAQICAFQFWKKDQENHEEAWGDYVALCKVGGSQSFLDLVKLANLKSPFEDGCVESIIDVIKAWLENVDDRSF